MSSHLARSGDLTSGDSEIRDGVQQIGYGHRWPTLAKQRGTNRPQSGNRVLWHCYRGQEQAKRLPDRGEDDCDDSSMTASLTSALRLRAFRPAARSAFEMISRASAAAVRSAARRRSWSRRLGPIGRAYLESSSAAKRQCLAFMYQEVCSGSRPRAAQTRVAGARLMATKGNDGRSCVLRTELADGDAAAHSEDLAA